MIWSICKQNWRLTKLRSLILKINLERKRRRILCWKLRKRCSWWIRWKTKICIVLTILNLIVKQFRDMKIWSLTSTRRSNFWRLLAQLQAPKIVETLTSRFIIDTIKILNRDSYSSTEFLIGIISPKNFFSKKILNFHSVEINGWDLHNMQIQTLWMKQMVNRILLLKNLHWLKL